MPTGYSFAVRNGHHQPPILPDRSTKPSIVASKPGNDNEQDPFNLTKLSDSLSSTIASTVSEMNNAMIESDVSETDVSEREEPVAGQPLPNVDRSLKAKALLKMGGATRKNLSDVIEADNDLIEETLQLEMKQLEIENRWEVFRLRREKSAEEDMKLEVMKNEDALLEELARMNEEKERKEKETEKLREQLNEIKVKMEKVNSNV